MVKDYEPFKLGVNPMGAGETVKMAIMSDLLQLKNKGLSLDLSFTTCLNVYHDMNKEHFLSL